MGSRFVACVAVIGVVALAAAGIYLYRHHGHTPRVEDKVATGEKPAPEPQKPAESKPPKSKPAESAPAKPIAVPSFDIVRIEPTGEGVMAGRAEPGWTIGIESGGSKIAETKADDEGAWSVVFDKPLASGDHTLALRATSPDGMQALTAQAPVQIAVAQKEPSPAEPPKQETAPAAPEQPKAAEAAPEAPRSEEPRAVEGQPEPVVPDESAPPPERAKPPVKIGKLDYQDAGADSGKISISGVGNPNIKVFLFFDEQPLGQVTIGGDGTWAIEIDKKLGEGEHTVRADTYDDNTGMVAGRASVRVGREPEAAKQQAALPAPESGPAPESAPAPEAAPAEPAVTAEGQPSAQPEKVYPDGAPEAEAASSEPSTSAVNTEPPSLSVQPQPIISPEEATSDIAKGEPAPAEPAQPEVSEQQPAAPQVEPAQPEAPPPPAPPKPAVVFKSVDYQDQDTGAETGKVALAGTGEPGAHVLLFFDETLLGEVVVGDDGTWGFEAEKKLETGEHRFRADRVEGGVVVGRASVGLVRMEKPKEPPKEQVATQAAPAPEAAPPAQTESQVAAAEAAKPAVTGEKQMHHKRHRPRVYTVRRGDTLWEIAESYYGGGWHYRAIVRDNKRDIKNPHWIYPKQKFHIPSGK
ncbi:MAG: LysM peptidoglycan-binding domain-containing protein [Methyloceanibacter sp.]